jgi:hypothetical protein
MKGVATVTVRFPGWDAAFARTSYEITLVD